MANLDPVAIPTLATLVTATVFSTTFLTNRIHREHGRAIDRALELDEQIASAHRDGKTVDAEWFDEQLEAIEKPLSDLLAYMALTANAILALGVFGLSIAFGVTAEADWGSAQGWGLIAFASAAFLVFLVGVLDFYLVRYGLRRRLMDTAMYQVDVAEKAFRKLRRKGRDDDLEKKARTAATAAVGSSRGLYAQAFVWRAFVELIRAGPANPDRLRIAGGWLDKAIMTGPRTAPMLAARAFVYEVLGESPLVRDQEANFEKAANALLEALELRAQGAQESRYDDSEFFSARSKRRITGEAGGPHDWTYFPSRPETLAPALALLPGRLSALDIGGQLVASRLAESIELYPERTHIALRGIDGWLGWLPIDLGASAADVIAGQLEDASDVDLVRELVTRARSDEGSIGRAKAAEAAERETRDMRWKEVSANAVRAQVEFQRGLQRIEEKYRPREEELLAELREAEERADRFDRGAATDDDRVWAERKDVEALATSDERKAKDALGPLQ